MSSKIGGPQLKKLVVRRLKLTVHYPKLVVSQLKFEVHKPKLEV